MNDIIIIIPTLNEKENINFFYIFLVPGPIPSCSPFDEIQFPGIKTQNDLTSVEKQANPSEFLILIIF